jgi:hypothetical protein
MIVSPLLAAYILDHHNARNRKPAASTVAAYARDMRDGRWMRNGDRIRFDQDGNLIDGQHRLMAIVAAGISIPMDFVFGLPNSVRVTVDGGRTRSVGDNYNILNGTTDGTRRASRINWIKKGLNPHRDRLSYSVFEQVGEFFERGLNVVDDIFPGTKNEVRAPIVAAFAIMAQAYPTKVEALLKRIKSLRDLETEEESKLANYVKTTNEREDTLFRKTLNAVKACITGKAFERLQTRGWEVVKEDAIAKIQSNREKAGAPQVAIEEVVSTPVYTV